MPGAAIVERAGALLASGQAQAAVDVLVGAAKRGDANALHELARWHVFGDPVPRSFATARALFERAGVAGHRAAARTHAVFVAMGAGGRADWGAALMLIERAARHDPVAARQAKLIAAMNLSPDGTPGAITPIEPLANVPRIAAARALFSADECAHVAALAGPSLTPSVVVDSTTGRQAPHPVRTSDGTVLGPIQQDIVVHALNRRIAAASGTRVEQGEPLSVLRYAPGQQYRLHHDCLPGEANQRIITAITYLNDAYEGGATHFPMIGTEFRGGIGDALLFLNTLSDGRPDERSRHAGLPVSSGEKWICTRWIRAHDFDPWGAYRA